MRRFLGRLRRHVLRAHLRDLCGTWSTPRHRADQSRGTASRRRRGKLDTCFYTDRDAVDAELEPATLLHGFRVDSTES